MLDFDWYPRLGFNARIFLVHLWCCTYSDTVAGESLEKKEDTDKNTLTFEFRIYLSVTLISGC